MFKVALFTTTKTWKQPKCPLTDEWTKMWFIYTKDYYSAMKKKEIMPFAATWVQLESLILNEVKSERERQIPYDIPYMWNLKYGMDEPIYRTETNLLTWRTDLWLPRGRGKGVGWTGSLGLVDANYHI